MARKTSLDFWLPFIHEVSLRCFLMSAFIIAAATAERLSSLYIEEDGWRPLGT